MKAMTIHVDHNGGTLRMEEVPDPTPAANEVLISVRAAALNRGDISQRAGRYRQQATAKGGPNIAGLEVAGQVIAVGEQVTRLAPGDRVMGQCSGAYAELVVVDERLLMPVPANLDWTHAAATPVSLVTGHDAISTNAHLRPGETVLIHAAGSVMGLAAVQIARILGARRVFGTVRGERRRQLVGELGAEAIDVKTEPFADAIIRETAGRGVDVVIDHVGGNVLPDNLRCMAVGGRLVSVGRLGALLGEVDLDLLARNRLKLIGVSFRTRTIEEFGDCVRRAADGLLDAVTDGRLRPIVSDVFPLEQALVAQEHMTANNHLGKIVLSVDAAE
jgi:NADPH:quinone reductase